MKKHRITISLTEAEYSTLKRMNALNGVPMARTVSELVSAVAPVLNRMADNLEKVKLADENIRLKLADSAEKSLEHIEKLRIEALGEMDLFVQELDAALDAAVNENEAASANDSAPRARASTARRRPPSSNTGVRSGRK